MYIASHEETIVVALLLRLCDTCIILPPSRSRHRSHGFREPHRKSHCTFAYYDDVFQPILEHITRAIRGKMLRVYPSLEKSSQTKSVSRGRSQMWKIMRVTVSSNIPCLYLSAGIIIKCLCPLKEFRKEIIPYGQMSTRHPYHQ